MVNLEELSADEILTGIFTFSKYSQIGERTLNKTILNLHDELGILNDEIASPGSGDDCPYFEEVEMCLSSAVTWRLLYHYDTRSGWVYEVPSKKTMEQKLIDGPFKLSEVELENVKKVAKRFDEVAKETAENNKIKTGYYLR